MKLQLEKLKQLKSLGLNYIQGDTSVFVDGVRTPDKATADSLIFVSKHDLVEIALKNGARYFVKTDDLDYQWPAHVTVFSAPSVSAGLAMILPFFDTKRTRFKSSANTTVHPSARIGDNVILGPYCVIGERAIIGAGCLIGAHVVIEDDAIVGANTILHPHVFIGARSEIGTRCEIHPHTTIGSDGYGYVTDPKNGQHHKIPHLGKVVIEDNVEIGANCAIDRGTLGETRLKMGGKYDNQIHIAHNCEIGENALITASFTIAGSTKIGKQFTCGGQAGVGDHLSIADNVTLAARGGFLTDISEPGKYGGFPAVKLQSHLKITRALQDLPEIWKSWRKSSKQETK
ncbi:MAG: UDP-3-O-(3-hydroxymyristoyl)glucosamine N-acyltransferase [Bdellovibrionales bacterium]